MCLSITYKYNWYAFPDQLRINLDTQQFYNINWRNTCIIYDDTDLIIDLMSRCESHDNRCHGHCKNSKWLSNGIVRSAISHDLNLHGRWEDSYIATCRCEPSKVHCPKHISLYSSADSVRTVVADGLVHTYLMQTGHEMCSHYDDTGGLVQIKSIVMWCTVHYSLLSNEISWKSIVIWMVSPYPP